MSERMKLIELQIGVTCTGMYSTVYLPPAGKMLVKEDAAFKKLVDDIGAAVAKVLTESNEVEGSPTSCGPGAEALVAALGKDGIEVKVKEKSADENLDDEIMALLNKLFSQL